MKLLCVLCVLYGSHFSVKAQSTNQSYPTPITANEISGKIPARDLGDARLTSFFYTFDGTQGDVFINVVTTNFNGDIDVFTADNLKPLTKITIYADETANETGRVIYLRQPAKLILRVEGRTPNDDAATFRIKFAGSFVASQAAAENPNAETPEVKSNNQTDVRVNSVGTIIEVKPKPTPQPKETVAKKSDKKNRTAKKNQRKESAVENTANSEVKPDVKEIEIQKPAEEAKAKIVEEKAPAEKQIEPAPTVVVTDKLAEKDKTKTADETKNDLPAETKSDEETTAAKEETGTVKETRKDKKSNPVKALPASALVNIRLVVLFKDGSKIERPMSEILKFSVDKGVLTIISKDGTIGRYSILEVEKTTIE